MPYAVQYILIAYFFYREQLVPLNSPVLPLLLFWLPWIFLELHELLLMVHGFWCENLVAPSHVAS